MSRRALARSPLAGACGALALTAATSGADGPRVVVRDAGGEVVAEAALPADGRFALAYRHSVYNAPAEERFRARSDDRFALESIASPSRRVLEYYEAEGRITRNGSSCRPTRRASRRWPWPRPSAAAGRSSSAASASRCTGTACTCESRWRGHERANDTARGRTRHPRDAKHLLDEFEAERPGRDLTGFPARLVAILGAGLALFAIFWVFFPMAPQVYRPAFLTVALLLTFVLFGRAKQPSVSDWVVAALAVAAIGYAVVDQRRARAPRRAADDARHPLRHRRDHRRARGHTPHDGLGAARDLHRVPVLRLLRRVDPRRAGDRPQGLRDGPHHRPDLHGPGGHLRHPARRRRDLHRPVRDLRRGARVLRRRALLRRDLVRRLRPQPHRPGAHERARGLPARHGLGLRRRHDGHARQRRLAAAAQGRLPEGSGRRDHGRQRHRRDPVTADARRRRVHHRRDPRGQLPAGAGLRARPVGPLLHRHPAGDRGRRPPPRRSRASTSRRPACSSCWSAGAITSRACS